MTFHPRNHATGRTGLGLLTPRASVLIMKRQSGLTIIELMIVLALIAILAGIAVPSFNSMIASNRVITTTNNLVSALNLARSESIKRSTPVEVAVIGAGWEGGWRVRVTGGATLRDFPAPTGNTTVTLGTAPTIFRGLATGTTATSFEVRDASNTTTQVRCVRVGATGRVSTDNGACS